MAGGSDDNMLHKQLNISRGTLFTVLLAVAVIFQVLPARHTRRLNNMFRKAFKPILDIGPAGFSGIVRPAGEAEFVSRSKYDELWKMYMNTEAALLEMQKRYEKLSRVKSRLPGPSPGLVLARVISSSIDGFGHEITINAGTADGIRTAQYVLDTTQTGIIGSISNVTGTTATVRLVTDARHTIMVSIRREGKGNIIERQMVGDGRNGCRVPLVPKEYDIRVGDIVYASARRGLLDTPVVIGEVSSVGPDRKEPLLLDIGVRPVFEPADLTELAVIVMTPGESGRK